MKILLFRRTISGEDGSTKVLVWLANSLSQQGYEVVVLTQRRDRSRTFYPLDESVTQASSGEGIKSGSGFWDRSSMRFRNKVAALADGGSFGFRFALTYAAFFLTRSIYKIVDNDRRFGDRFSPVLARKGFYKRWLKENHAAISNLTQALRDHRPDVVVSFFTAAHFLIAEAARRSKTPIVCFYNGDPRVYPQRIGERFTELSKTLRPQAFTILNPVFYSDLPEQDRKIAHVIPNYVRGSIPALTLASKEKIIISVGRLHPQKNHELLIDSFARIEKKFPDWRVEIYGEGEHRQALSRKISALGLQDRIVLKGATQEIESVYASASIHAFPSLCEGFGLVVIEAMSAGLPAVSVEGVYPSSDFVIQSGSGLIAQPTPDGFAMKLEELMRDPVIRQQMGERGVAYSKKFSSGNILDKWKSLLEEVAKNGMSRTENRVTHTVEFSAGERLPVPDSANVVPGRGHRAALEKSKGAKKRAPSHAWHSPSPSQLGYPRTHPENGYDALDFLRSKKVFDLNQEVVERVRLAIASTGRKVKVGFLVCEREKWNGDQLLRELENSGNFDCSFAVHLSSTAARLPHEERASDYEEQVTYFKTKGKVEFDLFDPERNQSFAIEDTDYDVLFIQQPWGAKDFPRRLVGRTLCVYMHYGFMMMANHGMHYNISTFHSYLWKYFTQTESHRRLHIQNDPSANDKIVVTGYPKLDVYFEKEPARTAVPAWKNHSDPFRRRIIFAPHHSVERNSLGMATFRWSGLELSSLRSEHQEIDWIYKPHPRMSLALQRAKFMLAEEYDAYVQEWDQGENSSVYDDGDYFDIFRSSDALITDCGSFLAEYLPTGKPIIWLVSEETIGLNSVGKFISEGFYQAWTAEELRQVFQYVVVEGNDPLYEVRRRAIDEIIPGDQTSSKEVANYLQNAFLPGASISSNP